MEEKTILIEWEPLPGQTFNPEYDGYTVGHYSTGNPELGWCLYSRGAGGCWNQRTKQIKAPASGLQPERVDGQWYWLEPDTRDEKRVCVCGGVISREAMGEPWEHASNGSIYCPNDDTGCSIAAPAAERDGEEFNEEQVIQGLGERLANITRDNNPNTRSKQIHDLLAYLYPTVNSVLVRREIIKHPVDAARDIMIAAGVSPGIIDESAVENARRIHDKPIGAFEKLKMPVEGIDNFNWPIRGGPINSKQAAESVPYDPDMQPFDMTMDGQGHVASFSMKTDLKVGEVIHFWGKPYVVSERVEKDGILRYSLTPDSIPEVEYRGSTQDGERYRVPPPTQTMIEDAGTPTTFVQDKLAEALEPDDYSRRHAQAVAYSADGKRRVANDPPPAGQKYAPGTRVRIADDLGSAMRHFPSGRMATVLYTHAHAYGGDDVKSYCLEIDGVSHSWYYEHQLTPEEGDQAT